MVVKESLRIVKPVLLILVVISARYAGAQNSTTKRRTGERVTFSVLAQMKIALRSIENASESALPPRDEDPDYRLYDPFTKGLLEGTQRDFEDLASSAGLAKRRGDADAAYTMLGLMEWLDHKRRLLANDNRYLNETERQQIDAMLERAEERYLRCHHVVYQILQRGIWLDDSVCDVEAILSEQQKISAIDEAAMKRHFENK